VQVEVEVSFSSESQFFVGLSGDLSEVGLFVATWRKLPLASSVSLALSLPDGPVFARGNVRWIRDEVEGGAVPGLGIAFDSLSAHDRARIEAFCAERAPLYYDVGE
jgi:uncharacterized protein (TIGR02266 family)